MHNLSEKGSRQTAGGISARTCLLLLLTALMVLPAGCGKRRIKETPVELIGTWRTSDTRYAGAYMQFTTEYLIIGTIENTTVTYLLTGFVLTEAEERTEIKVYYEDVDGYELSMELAYLPQDGGTLVDMHQRSLAWKKEPE
jgi:hypothetical protein